MPKDMPQVLGTRGCLPGAAWAEQVAGPACPQFPFSALVTAGLDGNLDSVFNHRGGFPDP